MKFYIKPKHFAQYRSFKVRDETQGELFKIKGRFFLGLRSLHMKDMNNEVLYTLHRKFGFNLYRTYEVVNEKKEVIAHIKRSYGFKKPMYTIEVKDHMMFFEGTVHDHAFSLNDQEGILANISKDTFEFGEAYEVDVVTEKRPLLHLFLVIAVDQMNHERKKFKRA